MEKARTQRSWTRPQCSRAAAHAYADLRHYEGPKLDLDEAMLVLMLMLVDCGRMLTQEECGEGEITAQPDAAQVSHSVAHPQDGQAQGHKDAAQHEDREHEQRLHITDCVMHHLSVPSRRPLSASLQHDRQHGAACAA